MSSADGSGATTERVPDDKGPGGDGDGTRAEELTYLEFYSGVGGWSYALEEACRRLGEGDDSAAAKATVGGRIPRAKKQQLRPRRLAAFDHSELCNAVLRHNFPEYAPPAASGGGGGENGQNDGATTVAGGGWGSPKTKKRRTRSKDTIGGDGRKAVSIEKLTPRRLRAYGRADVWAMSPPCQPYTRQHSNQAEELNDPRNKSFLHLIELVGTLIKEEEDLPSVILMENVVGFEKSVSCGRWISALASRRYRVAHFHATPTQVGLPNDRPRYYCVAVRERGKAESDGAVEDLFWRGWDNESNEDSGDTGSGEVEAGGHEEDEMRPAMPAVATCAPAVGIREDASADAGDGDGDGGGSGDETNDSHKEGKHTVLPLIASFLDADLCDGAGDPIPLPSSVTPSGGGGDTTTKDADESATPAELDALRIPTKVLNSDASWCFDIVTPRDARSACFTHSYGNFVRGTGSVLFMGKQHGEKGDAAAGEGKKEVEVEADASERFKLVPPEGRRFDGGWSDGLELDRTLRYFSGTEIARIMGFPVAAAAVSTASSAASPSGQGDDAPNSKASEGGAPAAGETQRHRTFSFPPSCTNKQRWRLLGNSLNVRVAARIAEVGLRGSGVVARGGGESSGAPED